MSSLEEQFKKLKEKYPNDRQIQNAVLNSEKN